MLPHHAETLARTTEHFAREPGVLALLLGGSLAHGFATPGSDVDVMIVVSDEEHERRVREGATCFFSRDLCTYADGYVDGKYISTGFMRQVRDRGSEPARFAFQDARLLFCGDESLPALLSEIPRYPTVEKAARLWRFQAQFEAWFWYCGEALKRENLPLLRTAVGKLTLFGGRIVLAHNEQLYPYHKWLLRVLEQVRDKPPLMLSLIERLARAPDRATIAAFGDAIRGFRSWEISHATWPAQFMADSELNWLHLPPPVDDI